MSVTFGSMHVEINVIIFQSNFSHLLFHINEKTVLPVQCLILIVRFAYCCFSCFRLIGYCCSFSGVIIIFINSWLNDYEWKNINPRGMYNLVGYMWFLLLFLQLIPMRSSKFLFHMSVISGNTVGDICTGSFSNLIHRCAPKYEYYVEYKAFHLSNVISELSSLIACCGSLYGQSKWFPWSEFYIILLLYKQWITLLIYALLVHKFWLHPLLPDKTWLVPGFLR